MNFPKHSRYMRHYACILLAAASTVAFIQQAAAGPVKIFILAGQSNMLGKGNISPVTTQGTLDYIVANEPAKYGFLKSGGSYVVRNDVWIRDQDPVTGGLTVGYGGEAAGLIGPELGFGHIVGDALENPVLIVKCAWGGKSLGFDFCPPSSRIGAPAPVADGDLGFYYKEILRLVSEATSNLATYVPGYVPADGYEIAGFAWHQGWNDRVTPAFSAAYETNMANFINDIRTDLGVPNMPFVIATTGMDGNQGHGYTQVEKAQLKMADTTAYPAFAGNVSVIDARATYEGLNFWQPVVASPSSNGGQEFHWNSNAKTHIHLGLAMGDAMNLMAPGRTPYRLRASGGSGGTTLNWKNGTQIPTSVRVLRNGVEIAASAPADPPIFVDATAPLGTLEYELQFTMPAAPNAALTIPHSSGVSDLTASDQSRGVRLSWKNNLAYSGIEVSRGGNLIATLAGSATTYLDLAPPAGNQTYTVVPSDPGSTPAQVIVKAAAAPRGTAIIYEPFDMTVASKLPGQESGVGIDNLWTGDLNVTVASGSLSFGSLPVFGNRINRTTGSSPCALFLGDVLQDAGLISPGSELWFSFLVQNPNNTSANPTLVIGNESVSNSTTVANSGSAIGVRLNQGNQVQPMIYKNGAAAVTGTTQATLTASETALVVGRIQWGATPGANSTISVYTPSSTDFLPDTPQTVSAALDFSNFRILSIWGSGTAPTIDEIRFGATYGDVIGAGADTTADFTPPSPGVMSFAVAPAAISETEITMTATTASDANGVQYRFHNVTLDRYSLWQGSPVFTDTGLIPGTEYIYSVQSRDISVNQNTTTASPGVAASTSPPDLTAPPVPGFASPPSGLSINAITMTAATVTDPQGAGVEYRFHNTTLGTNSGWQSSTTYIATGLSPNTSYAFTVQARDTAFYQNASAQSAPLNATTYAITTNNGTWNVNSGGNWSYATNWLGNLVANGAGFTANINMTGTGDRTITLDSARTIGILTRSWAVNNILTIGGTSVLTFEVPSGTPTITNNDSATNRRMIITAPIAGTQGLAIAGGGMVQISNNTSIYTGSTTVNGFLDFGGLASANIGGGSGRNITVGTGATVRFDTLSNALLNRIADTNNVITVMTGATNNNLDFSSSTGANLPNAFLGNFASNGAKCEYSGIITPASDAYRLGAANGSGLLGITKVLSGSQGLIVGGRVNLVAANTFTGDTTIPTGAKLVIGNNLALQNSALDVGSAGGTFACAAGTATGKISGETAATSPTFGGLKGSRNLSSAFTASSGGNNESNLAATAVTGFTLNVGTGKTCTYTGAIGGFGASGASTLTKNGGGTQTLSGINTYTGATNVNQGTLALVGGSQTSAITVASGASLGFTIGSPTTSTKAVALGTGTVKITGTVDNSSDYLLMTATLGFTGSLSLSPSVPGYGLELRDGGKQLWLVSTGTPYSNWSLGAAPDADTNHDGVDNAIAWALGAGGPNENAIGLLPTLDNSDPTYVIFTFQRSDAAQADPNTSITVQYGSDLTGWTAAVDDNNNVEIETTNGAPKDTVIVKLKRSSLGASGKLFARLRVVVTP